MTHLLPLGGDWALWRLGAVRGAGMPIDWLTWFVGDSSNGPSRMLAEPAFVSALAWQNPRVVRAWAGRPGSRIDSKRARVLARYAQRYCAKNESIGFFGSVGWARLTDRDDEELTIAGRCGVRWADVFFEHWAIEELAKVWAQDECLLKCLPVRWHSAVTYEGDTVRRRFGPPLPVEPSMRPVLERVDGVRPVGDVAGSAGDAAVRGLLRLRDAGVLRVGFAIPVGERPERHLRACVDAIADEAARGRLGQELDRLEAHRASIAVTARHPDGLVTALAALEDEFSRLTGRPATREKGTADAGRTLVYLDCRRDLDIEVPSGLIKRLATPLRLLLQSARWLTEQVSDAVEDALSGHYCQLRERRDDVTLSELHFAAAGVLSGSPGTPIHDVAEDFQLRWKEIFDCGGTGGDADEIGLSSAAIAPLVGAMFPAQAPGWMAARYHSPDLMLARTADGFRAVLGELHLAMNTLDARCFHTLADDPAALVAATADDMASGRVVPCYPHGQVVDSRRYPPLAAHLPDRYFYWSYGDDVGAPPGSRSWPASALRVRHDGEMLVAGPCDGAWELPVREFFGEFLSALVVNRFRMPQAGPRVVIDDLVVRRRSWRFGLADLPREVISRHGYFPARLSACLTDLGLPRYLFARTPREPKPFYVDLQAPLMVANLARAWRKLDALAQLELQEMLPGPDELWLTDEQGQRYTAEFRFVAVDRRARPGLPVPPRYRPG